ncbi:MAG: tetratricopeptide repeat protein [Thermodesulfobacteriota bacterium]
MNYRLLTLLFTIGFLLLSTVVRANDSGWRAYHTNAAALSRTGDLGEAYQQAKTALNLARTKYGPDHLNTAKSLEQLGEICAGWGRLQQADLFLNGALRLRKKIHGDSHPSVIKLLVRMADCHRLHRDLDKAEKLYRQALDLVTKGSWGECYAGPALEGMARLHSDQGAYSRAEPLYEQAIDIFAKGGKYRPAEKLSHARCLIGLGDVKWAKRELSQAREAYEAALVKYSEVSGHASPMTAYAYKRLADLYALRGVLSVALTYFHRALGAYERTGLPEGAFTAATLAGMADVLKSQGRTAKATECYNSAVAIYERTGGLNRELATTALTKEKIWPSLSQR